MGALRGRRSGPLLQLGASLEKSQRPVGSPAEAAQIALFAPYCGGLQQEEALRRILPQLKLGRFEGRRALDGGGSHAYALTWSSVRAPLTPCTCELTFPDSGGLHYSFVMPAHQLATWLMQLDPAAAPQDLPDPFWHWLLLEHEGRGFVESGPLH